MAENTKKTKSGDRQGSCLTHEAVKVLQQTHGEVSDEASHSFNLPGITHEILFAVLKAIPVQKAAVQIPGWNILSLFLVGKVQDPMCLCMWKIGEGPIACRELRALQLTYSTAFHHSFQKSTTEHRANVL
jgi:hypothetical protein